MQTATTTGASTTRLERHNRVECCHVLMGKMILLTIAAAAAATPTPSAKPTVLHVVADDLGYADLGYKNNFTESATLDHLATNGVRLTSYYVQVVCSPTRAAMLTGL